MSVAKSLLEQRVHLGILNSSEAKTNLVKSKRLRKKQPSHLIIEARAGTGKTTTLIEGLKKLKGIKSDHPAAKNPSPQQKDIWNQLLLSKDALSIAFIAFNKSIADELRSRVPSQCEAMTCHSLGYKSVLNTYPGVSLNNDYLQETVAKVLGTDLWQLRKKNYSLLTAMVDLADLCKQNLLGYHNGVFDPVIDPDILDKVCSRYDIDLDKHKSTVYSNISRVLEESSKIEKGGKITFTDMIWLPIVNNLPISSYDLLLVDEAQDLNRCQQALVRKAGSRLILCGDPKQAIYGFAGADSESMNRMFLELDSTPERCVVLPLNYTRRCGKAIVREANKIVPDFYAFDENPEGLVDGLIFKAEMESLKPLEYRSVVKDGDMVLCRVNAPLVSECFKFLKEGRKAFIQGRDIGKTLIKTIRKIEKNTFADPFNIKALIYALDAWLSDESEKEQAKKFPSETKLASLTDRYNCLMCFCDSMNGEEPVDNLITKIEFIFSDTSTTGIRLSSVHKAKGLEADRVFILMPEGSGMPHPMAKQAWEKEQEMNLKYVAITRAIHNLYWVKKNNLRTS